LFFLLLPVFIGIISFQTLSKHSAGQQAPVGCLFLHPFFFDHTKRRPLKSPGTWIKINNLKTRAGHTFLALSHCAQVSINAPI
jgi:hypothetical protein